MSYDKPSAEVTTPYNGEPEGLVRAAEAGAKAMGLHELTWKVLNMYGASHVENYDSWDEAVADWEVFGRPVAYMVTARLSDLGIAVNDSDGHCTIKAWADTEQHAKRGVNAARHALSSDSLHQARSYLGRTTPRPPHRTPLGTSLGTMDPDLTFREIREARDRERGVQTSDPETGLEGDDSSAPSHWQRFKGWANDNQGLLTFLGIVATILIAAITVWLMVKQG